MNIDTELHDNGIFLSTEKNGFRCSICTIDTIFWDAKEHIKTPIHIKTLERFNLSFVKTPRGVSCRVCGDNFDWKAFKTHAKSHGFVPWYKPLDIYKTFFASHIVEWDNTQFYCYPCDIYFSDWSTAYIHAGKKLHQQLVKEHRPVNDFIGWSSIPYNILVANGFISSKGTTTVDCSICDCTNIGIKNVLAHVEGVQHVHMKKEFVVKLRESKLLKNSDASQPKARSIKQSTNDTRNKNTNATNTINDCLPCIFVIQTTDNKYSCEICDLEFNCRAYLDFHVKGGLHSSSITLYGCDNILHKQTISADNYHCKCCDCTILGIKNVHQHVRGLRHWESLIVLSATKNNSSEFQVLTTNNNIVTNEKSKTLKNVSLSFTNDHIEQIEGGKFVCKLCDAIFMGINNIPQHIAGRIHSLRSKHLLDSFYLKDQTNYHCKLCNCIVPGLDNIYGHLKGNRHNESNNLHMMKENKTSIEKLEKMDEETKDDRLFSPEVVLLTDEHIDNRKGGEFHCKLCDETIHDNTQLQHHLKSENHICGIKQLAEYISLKKDTNYHCKCCNCAIPGLENVYSHIGGNRHVKSLIELDKEKQGTSNKHTLEVKKQPENIIKPSCSSASSSFPANALSLPNNHIEKQKSGEFCCRLCNKLISGDFNIQEHLKGKPHLSNDQLLSTYISFTERNCYHCRCCNCTVPGIENIYRHIHGSSHVKILQIFEKSDKDSCNIDSLQHKSSRIEKINHIVKINDTLSHCQLCDCKNLKSSAVENHIAEKRHIEILKLFSSLISLKKNNKFYCKSCDWIIYGIDNVYTHLQGNKHMNYHNTTNKAHKIGSTESIDGRSSTDSNKSHSKIRWIKPSKDLSVREVICKICNIVFADPSDLHSHLTIHVGKEFTLQEEMQTAIDVNKDCSVALQNKENGTAELQLKSEMEKQINLFNGHSMDNGTELFTASNDLALSAASEMLPSTSTTDTEVKRRSPVRSSRQTTPKLINLDNDYIYETGVTLREFELGIKLCLIKESNDLYCLICHQIVNETLQNYYNHLKTPIHREYLEGMKKDHAMFEMMPNKLSVLDLAHQYIEEVTEDLVRCHACKKHLVNTYYMLKRHIDNKIHEDTCKQWHLRAKERFESTKPRVQCDWYDIHKYRCEPCSEDFTSELKFAKHLKSTGHTIVLRKSMKDIEKETFNDFCGPCALLWFGFSSTYENHCENPKHKWAVWKGQCESQDLPISVQNHLTVSEQYIDDTIKHLYVIAPMERDKEDTLIRNLEMAVKTEIPSAKAFLFRSRADGFNTGDSDVEIFLDCGNMYYGEKSSEDKILHFMITVCRCLDTNSQSWYENTLFTNSRLSIIKVRHRATGLTCGITFSNGLPVENMKLITYFTQIFLPCRKLILFLNQWLLLCDSAELQSIPYHALYWCVIFYLQKESFLPSVASMIKDEYRLIDGWNVGVSLDVSNSRQETSINMREFLIRFFKFYANFDYQYEVACPLLGRTVKKRAFADPQNLPKEMAHYIDYVENSNDPQSFKSDSVMCIQDPLNLQRNLTENVSKACLSRFRDNCAKSLNIICFLQM